MVTYVLASDLRTNFLPFSGRVMRLYWLHRASFCKCLLWAYSRGVRLPS